MEVLNIMAREEVSFARGAKSTIPSDKVPGRLLVATDTGEAYVDDTSDSRVQLKDSTKVSKSGDTMTGTLNMGSHKITGVSTPSADTDAANYGSVKSEIQKNQYTGGTAITVDNENHTVSHSAVGTAGSVGPTANATPAPGGTFQVPQITTDAQGHVSSKTNRTITVPKYTAGTGLSISGTVISHKSSGSSGSVGPEGDSTASYGSAITVPAITTDALGHVTAKANRSITLPEGPAVMVGATPNSAGSAGYAPAPTAGQTNRFLRGDGTWAELPDTGTTYTADRGLSIVDGAIGHSMSIVSGGVGPAEQSTLYPGSNVNIPQIHYDEYGHITSSTESKTITLDPDILDKNDIVTSLSGVDSNEKVLGAKVVADAINQIQLQTDNYMPKSGGTFTGPVMHDSTMSVGAATFSYETTENCVTITFA